jgi:WD40 repeat protein
MGHLNKVHANFVNCVRYSPNGQYAISVSTDKKIQLYDGATGQPTKDIPNAHDGGAKTLITLVAIIRLTEHIFILNRYLLCELQSG